jgi:hypothetical protein
VKKKLYLKQDSSHTAWNGEDGGPAWSGTDGASPISGTGSFAYDFTSDAYGSGGTIPPYVGSIIVYLVKGDDPLPPIEGIDSVKLKWTAVSSPAGLDISAALLADAVDNPNGVQSADIWPTSEQSIVVASNDTPIVITSESHGLNNGNEIYVHSALGNTAANGKWTVANVTEHTFELAGSSGNGDYAGGGVFHLPVGTDVLDGSFSLQLYPSGYVHGHPGKIEIPEKTGGNWGVVRVGSEVWSGGPQILPFGYTAVGLMNMGAPPGPIYATPRDTEPPYANLWIGDITTYWRMQDFGSSYVDYDGSLGISPEIADSSPWASSGAPEDFVLNCWELITQEDAYGRGYVWPGQDPIAPENGHSGSVTITISEVYFEITIHPTIISVDPPQGGVLGQDPVSIIGTGFAAGISITFDGLPATNVNVISETLLTCVTPAHAVGSVDVTALYSITDPTDSSTGTLPNGYLYQLIVTAPTPDAGPPQVLRGPLPAKIFTEALAIRGQNNGLLTYLWEADGNAADSIFTIKDPTHLNTEIRLDAYVPGNYPFILTVRDEGGYFAIQSVLRLVVPPPNPSKITMPDLRIG